MNRPLKMLITLLLLITLSAGIAGAVIIIACISISALIRDEGSRCAEQVEGARRSGRKRTR